MAFMFALVLLWNLCNYDKINFFFFFLNDNYDGILIQSHPEGCFFCTWSFLCRFPSSLYIALLYAGITESTSQLYVYYIGLCSDWSNCCSVLFQSKCLSHVSSFQLSVKADFCIYSKLKYEYLLKFAEIFCLFLFYYLLLYKIFFPFDSTLHLFPAHA